MTAKVEGKNRIVCNFWEMFRRLWKTDFDTKLETVKNENYSAKFASEENYLTVKYLLY